MRYDPRLKNLFAESGDIEKFVSLNIRRSTLREWIKNGRQEFITLPELEFTSTNMIREIIDLKASLAVVVATKELVATTVKKCFGSRFNFLAYPRLLQKVKPFLR